MAVEGKKCVTLRGNCSMLSSKASNPLLDERRHFLIPNMLRCPRRSASHKKTARGSGNRMQSPSHIVSDLWNPGICLPQTVDFLPWLIAKGWDLVLTCAYLSGVIYMQSWSCPGIPVVWHMMKLVAHTLHLSIYTYYKFGPCILVLYICITS